MFYTKRSGIYVLNFKQNNKWIRKSTGQTTKAQAELWASSFLNPLPQSLLLSTATPLLFKELSLGRQPTTLTIYAAALKHLLSICGDKSLPSYSYSDIQLYKQKRGTSNTSINIELRALRFLFKTMQRNGYITKLPEITLLPSSTNEMLAMTDEHLQRLLDVSSPELRLIFKLAVMTGLRLNEIVHLTWGDISLTDKRITIKEGKLFRPKVNRITYIRLSAEAVEFISSIQRNGDFVLGKRYRKDYVPKAFRKMLKKAGLPLEYHFHCLRHTYVTRLVDAGVHTYDVMKLARHTSISTTMRYYHANDDKLAREADRVRIFV